MTDPYRKPKAVAEHYRHDEQRHYLAQEICTFNQGRIADRGTETQQFRASGLNLDGVMGPCIGA
jgi:hypothetical protein